ncbi:MAG: hypothetical protein AAGC81_03885 [Pseudomonadota bacterium]
MRVAPMAVSRYEGTKFEADAIRLIKGSKERFNKQECPKAATIRSQVLVEWQIKRFSFACLANILANNIPGIIFVRAAAVVDQVSVDVCNIERFDFCAHMDSKPVIIFRGRHVILVFAGAISAQPATTSSD